jgi:hypothetical protein
MSRKDVSRRPQILSRGQNSSLLIPNEESWSTPTAAVASFSNPPPFPFPQQEHKFNAPPHKPKTINGGTFISGNVNYINATVISPSIILILILFIGSYPMFYINGGTFIDGNVNDVNATAISPSIILILILFIRSYPIFSRYFCSASNSTDNQLPSTIQNIPRKTDHP